MLSLAAAAASSSKGAPAGRPAVVHCEPLRCTRVPPYHSPPGFTHMPLRVGLCSRDWKRLGQARPAPQQHLRGDSNPPRLRPAKGRGARGRARNERKPLAGAAAAASAAAGPCRSPASAHQHPALRRRFGGTWAREGGREEEEDRPKGLEGEGFLHASRERRWRLGWHDRQAERNELPGLIISRAFQEDGGVPIKLSVFLQQWVNSHQPTPRIARGFMGMGEQSSSPPEVLKMSDRCASPGL